MMRDFAIYLDLDGVVADHDAGIRVLGFNPDPTKKNDLNRSGTGDPFKRAMYEAIKGTEFYAKVPLMPGAADLYRAIQEANPIILTAAPLFGATEDNYFLNPYWLGAVYHKRRWVETVLLPTAEGSDRFPASHRYHIPIPDDRFICTTSTRKHEFIGRKHSDHQILIDDRRDNCVKWARAGGVAILHETAEKTIQALADYGCRARRYEVFQVTPGGGRVAGLEGAPRTWAEMEAEIG